MKSATDIVWANVTDQFGKSRIRACVRSGQQIRIGKTGVFVCRAGELKREAKP